MTLPMRHLITFVRSVAIWFVVVLPFAPWVWGAYMSSSYCRTDSHLDPAACLFMAAYVTPFGLIFGPLAGTVDEPINRWPDLLVAAFILAVCATTLGVAWRWLTTSRSK